MSSESATTSHRGRLSAKVAGEIRRRILNGQFETLGYLPAERKLAKKFGVSRGTVVAALESLGRQGLVQPRHGRGTFVTAPTGQTHALAIAIVMALPLTGRIESSVLVAAIIERLHKAGCRFEMLALSESDQPPEQIIGHFDAALFFESPTAQMRVLAERLHRDNVPIVVANMEGRQLPVSATYVDHAQIAQRAVTMLTDLGHRRIAFVGNRPEHYFYGNALAGYKTSLEKIGIDVDASLIVTGEGAGAMLGYRAMSRFLTMKDPPSAVFAARDSYAEGLCQRISEAGLVVGRDVSVIGYDDYSWPASEPILTTFREPIEQLGAEAVTMLLDRIVTGKREPEQLLLDTPLVLRRSAGPYHPIKTAARARTRKTLAHI